MRRVSRAAAVGVLLVVGAADGARGAMTDGFRTMKSRPMIVAVLPARAEFIRARAVVTEDMRGECAALEREAAVAVRTNLEMLGYQVRLLTTQDLEKDGSLRELVGAVNGRFGTEWKSIVRGTDTVKQGRAAAGDDAARLAAHLGVQGLAVARVVAVTQGDGDGKASPLAPGGAAAAGTASYGRLDVGILSGKAGRIEAFFTGMEGASLGQLTGRPAKVMGRAAEEAFSACPASTEPGRARQDIPLPVSDPGGKGRRPGTREAALRDLAALLAPVGSGGRTTATRSR